MARNQLSDAIIEARKSLADDLKRTGAKALTLEERHATIDRLIKIEALEHKITQGAGGANFD